MINHHNHKKLAVLKNFCSKVDDLHILKLELTGEQFEALNDKGYWLEGLAHGKLIACTDAQKRFIDVCKNKIKPKSIYEIAWVKYIRHLNKLSSIKIHNDSNIKKSTNPNKTNVRKNVSTSFKSKKQIEFERSTRIIKSSVLNGSSDFIRAKASELKKGVLTEEQILQIYDQWKNYASGSNELEKSINKKIKQYKARNPENPENHPLTKSDNKFGECNACGRRGEYCLCSL